MRETQGQLKNRAQLIIALLKKQYPNAHCALDHKTPFQLLIATILSAQCTDERVNKVTPQLFQKFPDAKTMAKARIVDLENLIRSTGFFKNKAKNIKACSEELVKKYKGEVPQTMELLHALPGVGRKTANVVLGNSYGIPGLVVDTHVMRLSNRFGFVKGTDAVKIELALQKLVPQEEWTMYSHYLIFHGRQVCKARSPSCETCFLNKICPKKPY